MLEKEFKYYFDNQDKFVKDYEGKYLVIVGEEIVGVYSSDKEVYVASKKNKKQGLSLSNYVRQETVLTPNPFIHVYILFKLMGRASKSFTLYY